MSFGAVRSGSVDAVSALHQSVLTVTCTAVRRSPVTGTSTHVEQRLLPFRSGFSPFFGLRLLPFDLLPVDQFDRRRHDARELASARRLRSPCRRASAP